MAIKTWVGTTSGWNLASNWSPAAAPTATDDLVFNNAANCNINTNYTVNSMNFTGYTGTLSGANSVTISGSDTGTSTGNCLLFSAGMTQSWTGIILFNSSVGGYITLNGKSLNNTLTFNNATGVWEVQDDLTHTASVFNITSGNVTFKGNVSTIGTLQLATGSLTVLNGKNVTASIFSSSNANIRTINMGSGTWNITGIGTCWSLGTSTNLTLNAEQSRIVFTNTSTNSATFAGGNLIYYTLEIARGSSTAATLVSGNNTFVNFIDNTSTVAHTVQFTTPGTTSFYRFIVQGSAGNLVTISRGISAIYVFQKLGRDLVSDTNYTNWTAGLNWSGSPANTWYVGPNSTVGTTVGIIASNPPSRQSLLGAGGVG